MVGVDMKNVMAAIGKKLTDYYNTSQTDSLKAFKKMARKSRLKSKNVDFEIKSLLFFAFDFGMASGPEKEARNQIRDYFLSALNIPKKELELMEKRILEYTNDYRNKEDNTQRLLSLGNIFATYTGRYMSI